MFQTICDQIPWDVDASPRARRLELMRRVLDGTLYEALPYEFHDERSASGEYIPLRRRRPSVRYALARIVVEDSVALLFSEGHFPEVASPDAAVRDALEAVARDCRLNQVMTEAAIRGSVGSCCLLLRVLQGRVFVDGAGHDVADACVAGGRAGRAGERDRAIQGAGAGAAGGRV